MISALLAKIKSSASDELVSRVVRGAGARLLITGTAMILGYVLNVMLARWMGAEEYGIFSVVMGIVTMLLVPACLGLNTASLRFLPQYISAEKWSNARGFVATAWYSVALAGSVFALSTYTVGTHLLSDDSPYRLALQAGALLIPLMALMSLQTEILRAIHFVGWAYIPDGIGRPILILASCGWLVSEGRDLDAASTLLILTAAMLGLLIVQALMGRGKAPTNLKKTEKLNEPRVWFTVAAPLLLTGVFSVILTQAAIVMVGWLLTPADAGVYSAVTKLALLVSFVLMAANTVAAPMFALLHSQGNIKELNRLVLHLAHWVFWPSLFAAFFIVVMGDWLLTLFGPDYIKGKTALLILLVGQIVNAGAGSVGYLVDLTGHQKEGARIRGYCALILILLCSILIPLFGIEGAAVSVALTMALWNVWLHAIVKKKFHFGSSIISALSVKRMSI